MSGPKGCGFQLQLITHKDLEIMKVSDLNGKNVAPVTPFSNPNNIENMPPDWEYVDQLLGPLIETIHIATLGSAVTIVIAFPLAFLAARNTTFPATWFIGRLILVTSRSVNTAVWGLLFVAIFGPGPMAGIWAIAARSIGFMGKLVAEAIEATGASRLQVLHVNFKTQEGFLVSVYWWERLSSRDFHYQLLCLCFW